MRQLSAIMMGMFIFVVAYGELPAGIWGYCWYVTPQGNVPACSVTIYCKRLNDGVVFTGNSQKYNPTFYVAQSPWGNDVYIPAGIDSTTGDSFRYAVAGYKYNTTGPYAGAWKMDYTGNYPYPYSTWSCGRQDIYLRKIYGTEPQGIGNE